MIKALLVIPIAPALELQHLRLSQGLERTNWTCRYVRTQRLDHIGSIDGSKLEEPCNLKGGTNGQIQPWQRLQPPLGYIQSVSGWWTATPRSMAMHWGVAGTHFSAALPSSGIRFSSLSPGRFSLAGVQQQLHLSGAWTQPSPSSLRSVRVLSGLGPAARAHHTSLFRCHGGCRWVGFVPFPAGPKTTPSPQCTIHGSGMG